MPTDHRAVLAKIKRFDQLIAYLRDEMGWPIAKDSFEDVDDLFYDFTADELGIDPKTAAKIESIKRLRPLSPSQPWGIFFIKFEPKKLPVVALRRILSQVALKKRASANSAERTAWAADDLLFISNYGEGDERRISFAHFTKNEEKGDLPTLKVLGWDNLDTALHLDEVADKLTRILSWPANERDVATWRTSWRSAFTLRHREVIATSRDLSIRLAELALAIRDRIRAGLKIETDRGPLTRLMKAFQEALVHDLDADRFADMYAQTIAYGLLSARIANPDANTADHLAAQIPVTNPFLKELMETFLHVGGRRGKAGGPGIDFDELGLSEVVELLDDANMEAVVRDFGDRNPQEDPVIHFYEHFLAAYDKKQKVSRGVFYTPRPVVSYIVRSVDELLRTQFSLEDGLADTTTWGEMVKNNKGLMIPDGVSPDQPFVEILDPATGTGTFLVEVIDLIHRRLSEKWKAEGSSERRVEALWNEYVPTYLLPRLHGYELLMAPYAIAHLKVGLKLYETGYHFGSDERARIYLTNALESASDYSGTLAFAIPALAHEADSVNQVKADQRFTVIIGNPPYSDASQNLGPQFQHLINRFRYYSGGRIRERGAIRFEHAINNDYVKFWGLALQLLSRVPIGVACLITSNSFLEGKSFRGLREGMLDASTQITITNLHGEGWAGQLAQAGTRDENVFEIQTGVAISELAKLSKANHEPTRVLLGELVGSYSQKLTWLSSGSHVIARLQVALDPRQYHSFEASRSEGQDEYWGFPQVDSFFMTSVDGIKTSRDGLVIGNSREECKERILRFGESAASIKEIEKEFRFRAGGWDVRRAQKHVRASFDETRIVPIAYRPLDIRYIYYDRELILSHRMNTMSCMLGAGTSALVFASRLSSKGFDHVVAASSLCSNKYASHDINSRMFPVIGRFQGVLRSGELNGNISSEALDRAGIDENAADLERARLFGGYVYALTNAPSYRSRYVEEISQDFPRVPLPRAWELGQTLAPLGLQLERAHSLDILVPDEEYVFQGALGGRALSPSWKNGSVWIGEGACFRGVERDVFEFRMAGYQVCKSWFSAGGRVMLQRRGLLITASLAGQYRSVLWAIRETIRIRKLIDEVIEQHGGWPGAFQAGVPLAAQEAEPLKKVAEPRKHPYQPDDPE